MRPPKLFLLWLGLLAAALAAPAAAAPARIALVVGNTAYSAVRGVPNAARDATMVGAALGEAGFTVLDAVDLPKSALVDKLGEFRGRVAAAGPDSVALIYYAGHGFSLGDEPLLLPVDARLPGGRLDPQSLLQLSALMDAASANKAGRSVVIVDACRNLIQFKDLGLGATTLLPPSRPPNSLLVFSTSKGYSAADGEEGGHSPFARAFVDELGEAGQPVGLFFDGVRDRILAQTGAAQQLERISTLSGDLVLNDKPISLARSLHYKAYALWTQGNHSQSTEVQREAAGLGDTHAMIAYADRLYYGKEVPADIDKAIVWYHRAAQAGDANGWFALGQIYESHPKVRNIRDSVKWLEKGIKAGSKESMYQLALMLQDNRYGIQDVRRAVRLYEASLDAYQGCAAINAALLYAKGVGVRRDYVLARKYGRLAADRGNVKGLDVLAYVDMHQKKYREAARLYRLGSAQGSAFASLQLGVLHANGWGVDKDIDAAEDYFYQGLKQAREAKDSVMIERAEKYLDQIEQYDA